MDYLDILIMEIEEKIGREFHQSELDDLYYFAECGGDTELVELFDEYIEYKGL